MSTYAFDGRSIYAGTELSDQFYLQDATIGVNVSAASGDDYIRSGNLADLLQGDAGGDSIYGGGGADLIVGDDGNDVLYGGTDNGTGGLVADQSQDTLYGGLGDDQLRLTDDDRSGGDTGYGGPGDDTYLYQQHYSGRGDGFVTPRPNIIVENANEGSDTVIVSGGGGFAGGPYSSPGHYTLPDNFENLILDESFLNGSFPGSTTLSTGEGNTANNYIVGNSSNNALFGFGGNDTLDGGVGADVLRGGAGDDKYSVDNAGDVVTELAAEGYDEVYASVNVTLTDNIETLFLTGTAQYGTGNAGNNAIIGNDVANILDAGGGSFEFLNGLGGNDILIGGAGHDEIMGGAGDDLFRFTSPSDGSDFFYDFTPGQDKIQLNASAFGLNTLSTGVSFIEGADVTTATPTVLYNQASGYLVYDPDGTGASAPTLLAILNGSPGIPALHASDFTFY